MGIEERFDEVKQLISLGKEKGYLLYDEVNDILPEDINSAEAKDQKHLHRPATDPFDLGQLGDDLFVRQSADPVQPHGPDAYALYHGEGTQDYVLALAEELRSSGYLTMAVAQS